MPVISIIVPVYKVEPYLRRCLDSVLAQTFTDYECILVDDGSPDECPVLCDEYAENYPQMRVIHQENGGLSDARNMGIRSAAGEYIVLLDSDDLLAAHDALENLYLVIMKTNPQVIFNSKLITFAEDKYCSSCDGINEKINNCIPIQFYKNVNRKIVLAGWLFTVNRHFLLKYNLWFKKGILHEDEHWMPRVICSAKQVAINHSPFYMYRKGRKGSIMSEQSLQRLFDKILIVKEIKLWMNNECYSLESKKILKWRDAELWYSIFRETKYIYKKNPNKYYQIVNELTGLRKILLGGKKIKYSLFFILVVMFGIKRLHQCFDRPPFQRIIRQVYRLI
jgi:glycosyltransferase involved in cell wall biosynthesis